MEYSKHLIVLLSIVQMATWGTSSTWESEGFLLLVQKNLIFIFPIFAVLRVAL